MIFDSSESSASRNSFSRCSVVTEVARLRLVCADSSGLRGPASSSAKLLRRSAAAPGQEWRERWGRHVDGSPAHVCVGSARSSTKHLHRSFESKLCGPLSCSACGGQPMGQCVQLLPCRQH